MTRHLAVFAASLLALFSNSSQADSATTFTYMSINVPVSQFPGAFNTRANGINARSDIVGRYLVASDGVHPFLLSKGTFSQLTAIDSNCADPDSGDEEGPARGINARGDIVGRCHNGSGTHGFVLSNGALAPTLIDFPGANSTQARGINNGEDIVGSYAVGPVTHGFLLANGAFSSIDVPGATSTRARGINDRGEIVGDYAGSSTQHGFVLGADGFTTIDVPGATSTRARGINERGDIVGDYTSASATHGFLRSHDGTFTTIDFPGSAGTQARGIDARGNIVGVYADSPSVEHGFLAIP